MNESCGELIISPEELARIRAACQRRAAEFEAAKNIAEPAAPPTPTLTPTSDNPLLSSEQEAQRFAAAIDGMLSHHSTNGLEFGLLSSTLASVGRSRASS
jgi:hypothetical protein